MENDNREIMVSVCMITYNHEKYVEQAIKSILNQKTNFRFELIIHDDASPDKTADIIKAYAQEYPEIIHTVLQTENQYSKGKTLFEFYLPLCRGKYFAFCEGDDYWIDEYKLQKQVDYMEAHPEVAAVGNRHHTVDKVGKILSTSHSGEICDRIFTKEDAIRMGAKTAHPNTIMTRLSLRKSDDFVCGYKKCCILEGHAFIIYYLCSHGGIYIMSDTMSVWRKVVEENGTNYESRSKAHPITYRLKNLETRVRFQDFFREEYDFSEAIVENATFLIRAIIKQSEPGVSKLGAFSKTMSFLTPKEKIRVFCEVSRRTINKVTKHD